MRDLAGTDQSEAAPRQQFKSVRELINAVKTRREEADDGAEAHPAPDLQDAAYLRSGGDQGPNSRALVSTHSCSSNWDNRGAIRLQQLIIVTD